MSRKRIIASENPTTLELPQELLDRLGVDDGDEVDVSIVDRTLILHPLDEVEGTQSQTASEESANGQGEDRLLSLQKARGIWKGRQDLPVLKDLRREWNRY